MCKGIELKLQEDNKTLEFRLSGYGEESSMKLTRDILDLFTNSGKENEEKESSSSNRIVLVSDAKANYIKSRQTQDLDTKKENPSNIYEFHKAVREEDEEKLENESAASDQVEEEEGYSTFYDYTEKHQAYYICKCGDRGKHRITRSNIYINCWKCGKRMRVRDAHMDGFPMKDDYGNTFIAGEFKRADQMKYGAVF